ncbi:hypothetical protein [Nonomuraea sp. NPDC049400]
MVTEQAGGLRGRRDVRPPSRALPEAVREEVATILAAWREGEA